jgi:hypothetical protein
VPHTGAERSTYRDHGHDVPPTATPEQPGTTSIGATDRRPFVVGHRHALPTWIDATGKHGQQELAPMDMHCQAEDIVTALGGVGRVRR